jgi:hypothetical protein
MVISMSKLIIEVNHEFSAGPFMSMVKNEELPLKKAQMLSMLEGAKPSDFAISIALLDPEEGWPSVGFEFSTAGLKKGGIFEYFINDDLMQATLKLQGTLSSSPLRSGVEQKIQSEGVNAIFVLSDFLFKGGKWKGFEAPIISHKKDDFKNWFRIKKWCIK